MLNYNGLESFSLTFQLCSTVQLHREADLLHHLFFFAPESINITRNPPSCGTENGDVRDARGATPKEVNEWRRKWEQWLRYAALAAAELAARSCLLGEATHNDRNSTSLIPKGTHGGQTLKLMWFCLLLLLRPHHHPRPLLPPRAFGDRWTKCPFLLAAKSLYALDALFNIFGTWHECFDITLC